MIKFYLTYYFIFFCERFVNFSKLLTIFTNNLVVLGDWATKSKNLTANIQYKISVQGMLVWMSFRYFLEYLKD